MTSRVGPDEGWDTVLNIIDKSAKGLFVAVFTTIYYFGGFEYAAFIMLITLNLGLLSALQDIKTLQTSIRKNLPDDSEWRDR